jgi:hypothetical protein
MLMCTLLQSGGAEVTQGCGETRDQIHKLERCYIDDGEGFSVRL